MADVEFGLDYILNHFESGFPRTISTLETENKQVEVYSRQEALSYFAKSNFVDCRISAFGRYEIEHEKPNLIFVDLDDKTALHETLALFHKEIDGIPSVLNTGNGYAIIQPITIKPLQKVTLDKKEIPDVAKKFLLFAERFLTNCKCDMGNHPSLRSCMIRVPYSYNKKCLLQGKSRQESQVTVHSEWNGERPTVKQLPFEKYLREQELKLRYNSNNHNYKNNGKIKYIEKLLQVKVPSECKQRIFGLIICPYLVNIRKLSFEECEKIIIDYFDGYISRQLIQYKIRRDKNTQFLPYSLKNMRENDPELHHIVSGLSKMGGGD